MTRATGLFRNLDVFSLSWELKGCLRKKTKTVFLVYKEISLTHYQSHLSMQWPMASTVAKGSLSHTWFYPKMSCLTNLSFKIRPLLPEYATWMTLCPQLVTLGMSSYDKPKHPVDLAFPRATLHERKWKICSLFYSPLLLLFPYDVTVGNGWSRNLLWGPRHILLSQAWQCFLSVQEEEVSPRKCYNQLLTMPSNTM